MIATERVISWISQIQSISFALIQEGLSNGGRVRHHRLLDIAERLEDVARDLRKKLRSIDAS